MGAPPTSPRQGDSVPCTPCFPLMGVEGASPLPGVAGVSPRFFPEGGAGGRSPHARGYGGCPPRKTNQGARSPLLPFGHEGDPEPRQALSKRGWGKMGGGTPPTSPCTPNSGSHSQAGFRGWQLAPFCFCGDASREGLGVLVIGRTKLTNLAIYVKMLSKARGRPGR